jgi:hypothetical protein
MSSNIYIYKQIKYFINELSNGPLVVNAVLESLASLHSSIDSACEGPLCLGRLYNNVNYKKQTYHLGN